MNIQEAINSNKRYRRKGELGWYDAVPDFPHYIFCMRDILAEDWELEEVKKAVTITREQLEEAWLKSLSLKELAEELGL